MLEMDVAEKLMVQNNRQHYRKNTASKGRIFLQGVELDMVVRNISITGFLAEIEASEHIKDIKFIFEAIRDSAVVDIFLEELHLAGEAEVVRADMNDERIYIALEFKNISYDAESMLFKRRAYRKSMTAPGKIEFAGKEYDFITRNVSVDGLLIRIPEYVQLTEGEVVPFVFDRLDLKGEIKVVWFMYDEDGGTFIGLQYIYMENTKVKSIIPSFYPAS